MKYIMIIDDSVTIRQSVELVVKDFGLGIKHVSQRVDRYSGSGLGVDIGMKCSLSNITDFGVTVQNIIQPVIKIHEHKEKYPVNIKSGISMKFPWVLYGL